jgi:hypothetical protein
MADEEIKAPEVATTPPAAGGPPPAPAAPIIHAPNLQTGNSWPTACGLPEGIISPVMLNVSCPACVMIWREQMEKRPKRKPAPGEPTIHAEGLGGTRTACGLDDPKAVVSMVLANANCERCIMLTRDRARPQTPLVGPGRAAR